MKNSEHLEIGKLLEEITGKGFSELQTDVNDEGPSRVVSVEAFNPDESRLDGIGADGESLVECFVIIVDAIRRRRGEPSLAEEAANIVEPEIAKFGRVEGIGCWCGSCKPLVVERKYKSGFGWQTGGLVWSEAGGQVSGIQPGEIGSCPDCGKQYRLRA